MKARTIALLSVMACGMAVAQTAPPSQKAAPVAKPGAAKSAMTQAKPASAAASKPAATPPASPMALKPAMPAAKKVAVKPAAAAVKKTAIRTPAASSSARRDPFTSPIREQGASGPSCSTGKKCLAINAMLLRGIVKSQGGMIAVVESSGRRISYFLRENDPVFNGYVVKITGDSVVFRENVMDRVGKQTSRDIVMKVVAPVV
jgi:Tfp pilus assembly protein PilP